MQIGCGKKGAILRRQRHSREDMAGSKRTVRIAFTCGMEKARLLNYIWTKKLEPTVLQISPSEFIVAVAIEPTDQNPTGVYYLITSYARLRKYRCLSSVVADFKRFHVSKFKIDLGSRLGYRFEVF
jgi:hypothetical protein